MIDLISYRCLPWCNHMDHFCVSSYFIYLMAQSVPHWWGMFFTQQTSCLLHVFLIHSSWYIGIYTVDTLLYSLCFTNCIIPFLPLLSIHPWVFTWVLQPELLLKAITFSFLTQWLLEIGTGSTMNNNEIIQVPQSMVCTNLNALINRIYLGIDNPRT